MSKHEYSKERWWDFTSAFLFMAAMLTAAARLMATRWVDNLDLVEVITFWGVILGLALGKSIFRWWLSLFFALAYGTFLIPWQLGLTLKEGIAWKERLLSIAGRLQVIVGDLLARREVTDNIFFLSLMALLFWCISVYGGYQLVRRARIWHIILPPGLAAFVIQTFDSGIPRRMLYLAVFLFFSLMILARITFLNMRARWEKNRFHVPPDAGYDITRIALIVTVILILLAWNTPAFATTFSGISSFYEQANRPWLEFKDRLSFAFSSLKATVGFVRNYYGNTQTLGLGSSHSTNVVLNVEAPQHPFEGARYYWRARVYDEYDSATWKNTIRGNKEIMPGDGDFAIGEFERRRIFDFKITPYEGLVSLYTPSQPIWVSRPSRIFFETHLDGSVDITAIEVTPYIRPGEIYEVRASLADVTQEDLRVSGTEYPEWILERYLQLPSTITPRTRLLAQQIAAGSDNPYDISEAVTQYLRETIEYTEKIEPYPDNQDVVDWFLFDYQKGFCNYYSTAQVILLRSLGIPARWALGYAQGEEIPNPENLPPEELGMQVRDTGSIFIVRNQDAHSWPEVFFPGIGWVEFEPTVSLDPIVRPESRGTAGSSNFDPFFQRDAPIPDDFDEPGDRNRQPLDEETSKFMPPLLILGIFLFVVGLFLGVLGLIARRRGSSIEKWWEHFTQLGIARLPSRLESGIEKLGFTPPKSLSRWAEYSLLPALAKAYMEINRALTRLGYTPEFSATPSERTKELVRLLPEITVPAYKLLSEYEIMTYGQGGGNLEAARVASSEIRRYSKAVSFRQRFSKISSFWNHRV